MRRIGCLLIAAGLLAGCSATDPDSGGHWLASARVNKFTKRRHCMVTAETGGFRGGYTKGFDTIYRFGFYPIVEMVNKELRLGVRSDVLVELPVGDVQVRIDDRKIWTIASSETPPDYARRGDWNVTMDTVDRAKLPYTMATGEKARAILQEMVAGTLLWYRVLGLNQKVTNAGWFPLDVTFRRALARCGISLKG